MKVLITGASGFLGTHLARKFLKEGHTVYGLVRNPKKLQVQHSFFYPVQGDLDSPELKWVNDLPLDLDLCVHTAGLVHSFLHDEFYQVNVTGTESLINSLKKKYTHALKFILISSQAAAGPSIYFEKKTEDDPDFPVSHYGHSKKQAEEILKKNAPSQWITSIVRPPMIIGPGDVAVLDVFKMVKSRVILLPGLSSLKKTYSFVCVFDLVETIYKLSGQERSLTIYSAYDMPITFRQLITTIKKEMKIHFLLFLPVPFIFIKLLSFILNIVYKFKVHNIRMTPDKINELKPMAWVCSSEKSKVLLGQDYEYDLKRTIAATYEDYKKRAWL